MSKKKGAAAPIMAGILALIAVIGFFAVHTLQSWTRQGDKVSFLPPSEWGFGRSYWDGDHASGYIYWYGFVERTTRNHRPRRP